MIAQDYISPRERHWWRNELRRTMRRRPIKRDSILTSYSYYHVPVIPIDPPFSDEPNPSEFYLEFDRGCVPNDYGVPYRSIVIYLGSNLPETYVKRLLNRDNYSDLILRKTNAEDTLAIVGKMLKGMRWKLSKIFVDKSYIMPYRTISFTGTDKAGAEVKMDIKTWDMPVSTLLKMLQHGFDIEETNFLEAMEDHFHKRYASRLGVRFLV